MYAVEADEPGYRFVAQKDTAIVVWRRAPTVPAVDRMTRFLKSVASKSGGAVHLIVVVDPDAGVPDSAARAAMTESMERTASLLRHTLAVVIGTGFKAALVRSAAAGMQLLAKKSAPTTVFDTPSAAIQWLIGHKGVDAAERDALDRAVQFAITGRQAR